MHTKSVLYLAALTALGLSLGAVERTLSVTPATLEGWTIVGADKLAVASEPSLTLPAGAQLSRQFPNSAVILRMVTHPEFSAKATEWPIAGVGPLAVAIVRKEAEGQLVLVVDETTAVDLKWSIPLEAKPAPIDLVLAYEPASGTGLVSFQGQAKLFDVAPATGSTDVWLSAGEKFAWPFDELLVQIFSPDTAESDAAGTGSKTPGKETAAEQLKAAVDHLLASGAGGTIAGPAPVAVVDTATQSPVSTLEVFTPPSVRTAQIIRAVRSVVAKNHGK